MQREEIRNHFEGYYRYHNMKKEAAEKRVNALYPKVLENNTEAFDETLNIIREKAFYPMCIRLDNATLDVLAHIDDVMQFASVKYIEKSLTNFDNFRKDNFYAYSLKFFRNWTEHYISQYCNKIKKWEKPRYEAGEGNQDGRLYESGEGRRRWLSEKGETIRDPRGDYGSDAGNPELRIIEAEEEVLQKRATHYFIQVLESSTMKPYQLVSYCYTYLLPKILKDHGHEPGLAGWVDKLNAPGQLRTSWIDSETGAVGGLIARDSDYLLGWACKAMQGKTIRQLAGEFKDIYNLCPLDGELFCWGQPFCDNLNQPYHVDGGRSVTVGELVLVEKFETTSIKNWGPRVMKKLLAETLPKIQEDPQLTGFMAGYAGNLVAKKRLRNLDGYGESP